MKTVFRISLIVLACLGMSGCVVRTKAVDLTPDTISISSNHPRLFIHPGSEKNIMATVESDQFLHDVHDSLLYFAEKNLSLPEFERIQIGRRLLQVSRKALESVWILAYSYRMTGDTRFADKAGRIITEVCGFSDWNPSHYLDVAEMTLAVAIAYDWCYDALPDSVKTIAEESIIEKGLKQSYLENADSPSNLSWQKRENNWNCVCNCGMTAGAIAIWEHCPELAKDVICRSIQNVTEYGLKAYQPNGCYPEGYTYWSYGTTFLTMMQDILESACNTDLGLADNKGFMNSGNYMLHMTTQGLGTFKYADCNNAESCNVSPMYWMTGHGANESLLYRERERIESYREQGKYCRLFRHRSLPLMILWSPKNVIAKYSKTPKEHIYIGEGDTPVAILRNHWGGDDEVFFALKAGSPSGNHAHMDVGSFCLNIGKNEWFVDMGPQDYHSIESRGLNLWDKTQESDRWKVFRYTSAVHNLIVFNDAAQRVDQRADIVNWCEKDGRIFADTDLTAIQGGAVKSHIREISIIGNDLAQVSDSIEGADTDMPLRWAALTAAKISVLGANHAELTQNGQTLCMDVEGCDVQIETFSAQGPNDYDAPNPGLIMIGFRDTVKASENKTIKVTFRIK